MTHISLRRTGTACALALAASTLALGASAAEVAITLTGVEARSGPLYVSLQSEDQFMREEAAAGIKINIPATGSPTYTLDVPAGDYALVVWHDDNGNGQFDRADNGEPLDGWAMSHGSELQGFPSFEMVRFEVSETGAAITEAMTYGR